MEVLVLAVEVLAVPVTKAPSILPSRRRPPLTVCTASRLGCGISARALRPLGSCSLCLCRTRGGRESQRAEEALQTAQQDEPKVRP